MYVIFDDTIFKQIGLLLWHTAKTMAAAKKELAGNFCAAGKNNGRVIKWPRHFSAAAKNNGRQCAHAAAAIVPIGLKRHKIIPCHMSHVI